MNLDLEIEFSKAPILEEVAALKKQIDDLRPLPADVEGRVMQKLRLDWNYNSNAIEGNKLSYGETTALLMHGITAKGKPLKDHLDIKGHNSAVEYLEKMVKDERDFTQSDIRGLHEVILGENYESSAVTADGLATTKQIQVGRYKSMPNHVKTITGEIHYYATPEETPAKMNDLMDWYNEAVVANINSVVVAALFHHRFVAIHPFNDGNGRMARILMNLILMRSGYPPVVVKQDDKQNYYALLSQADTGNDWPFIEYISERLRSSLNLYMKAIDGGDIDEDDDVKKKISLFKMELSSDIDLKDKKSNIVINQIFQEDISNLINGILVQIKEFDDLFFTNKKFIRFRIQTVTGPSSTRHNIRNNKIEGIGIPNSNINSTEVHFLFSDFKKSKNMFAVEILVKIVFEEYYYSIISSSKKINKYYHEHISLDDSKTIVNDIVEEVIAQIKRMLKDQ